MGKKVRMKWRKLDVVQQEERDNEEEVLDNENPFLKVHLLNLTLFMGSKYIPNIQSINAAQQYTGAPIHYDAKYSNCLKILGKFF